MKSVLFILLIVILLFGAGVVLARPVDQNGEPAAYPVMATVTAVPIPYPAPATITPTETAVSVPETNQPARPTKTPTAVIGEPALPPVIPDGQ